MKLNHIFSLITFAIGALCFMVLVTTLKPQLHDPRDARDEHARRPDLLRPTFLGDLCARLRAADDQYGAPKNPVELACALLEASPKPQG
jgi:hypothetical protein